MIDLKRSRDKELGYTATLTGEWLKKSNKILNVNVTGLYELGDLQPINQSTKSSN